MPLVIKFCVLLLSVSLLGCSGGDPVGSVVTRIPAKYRDPQTSELSVTINEGENDKLMIEIVK